MLDAKKLKCKHHNNNYKVDMYRMCTKLLPLVIPIAGSTFDSLYSQKFSNFQVYSDSYMTLYNIFSFLPKNNSRHDRRVWPVVTSKVLVSFLSNIKQKSVLKACRADMP